mgnify:CR=1 FL=1
MRNLLKYLVLHIVCFGCIFPLSAGEDSLAEVERATIQDEVISAFHNSMGFDYLTKEESSAINLDSILNYLESTKQYNTYFELERILIKSYLFRGEIRLAIDWSEQMYSKASALSHALGTALALNAISEVYSYTGRNQEAGSAHVQALEMFDQMSGEGIYVRMLLLELVEHNLRIRNFTEAAYFMARLNRFSADSLSEQEQAVRHIFNAYCQLFKGSVKTARQHLDEVEPLREKLIPGIMQHLLIAEAMYWERTGEYEKSLTTYDAFLHTDYAEINSSLYKGVLQDKADLLVKMGRKEEAYKQYGLVFSYIKSSFEKNYPKEIDQLTTRFQADRLTYQNERDRLFSYRLYLGGIVVCTLFLLLFLYLSWRKIFRLKESKCSQEKMIQKAERAIQKKNMFLSNMSHEVRTPLNAIVGFSQLLAETDDPEERHEFVEIIDSNNRMLLQLISDILDLAKIESGTMDFKFADMSIKEVINEIVTSFRIKMPDNVALIAPKDSPECQIYSDRMRLTQVISNFLNNAIKYTSEGCIILAYEIIGDEIKFSVTDTGDGMSQEIQAHIFDRFYKGNTFKQGTGLGLSICETIVNRLGGRIGVNSELGKGSTFWFTHPYSFSPNAKSPASPNPGTI